MAGALLHVKITDPASQIYADIATRLGKARGLMDAIGAQLVSSTLRRFQTQTGPDGRPWTPLARSTLRQRGANAKALLKSGRLRQSITWQARADSVEVGSTVVYAAIHQFGGTIHRHAQSRVLRLRNARDAGGKVVPGLQFAKAREKSSAEARVTIGDYAVRVPARPYLGISAADETAIARIAHDYVMGTAG